MTRISRFLAIVFPLVALAASAVLYPQFPERVPIHWNIHGQVDGWGDKAWAVFLTPGIMTAMLALFAAFPWLSPKRFSLDSFLGVYWFIIATIEVTMAYIHGLTLWAAWIGPVDITRAMLIGLLAMFGLIGGAMRGVRQNFWVGVRTPWTIASERVWNDTHVLAARTFIAAAVIGMLAAILPFPIEAVAGIVIALIMGAAFTPVIYSLVHYKALERRGEI